MRFVCSRCRKLVDEKEVIIVFADAIAVTHILSFHNKCWKKEEKEREKRDKDLEKVA